VVATNLRSRDRTSGINIRRREHRERSEDLVGALAVSQISLNRVHGDSGAGEHWLTAMHATALLDNTFGVLLAPASGVKDAPMKFPEGSTSRATSSVRASVALP
jgi:hypothetical protein